MFSLSKLSRTGLRLSTNNFGIAARASANVSVSRPQSSSGKSGKNVDFIGVPVKHVPEDPELQRPMLAELFQDRMVCMKYNRENGWLDHEITGFSNIALNPTASALLHGVHAQEVIQVHDGTYGRRIFRARDRLIQFQTRAHCAGLPSFNLNKYEEALNDLIGQKPIETSEHPSLHSVENTILSITCTMLGSAPDSGVDNVDNALFYATITPPQLDRNYTPEAISLMADVVDEKPFQWPGEQLSPFAERLKSRHLASSQGCDALLPLDKRGMVKCDQDMQIFTILHDNDSEGQLQLIAPSSDTSMNVVRDTVLHTAVDLGLRVVESDKSVEELRHHSLENELVEMFAVTRNMCVYPVCKVKVQVQQRIKHCMLMPHCDLIAGAVRGRLRDIYYNNQNHPWMQSV